MFVLYKYQASNEEIGKIVQQRSNINEITVILSSCRGVIPTVK